MKISRNLINFISDFSLFSFYQFYQNCLHEHINLKISGKNKINLNSMSRYQNFYDEQPFQNTPFHIDSPTRNPLDKKNSQDGQKSLHAYFNDNRMSQTQPEHINKAMHHQEIRLLSNNSTF